MSYQKTSDEIDRMRRGGELLSRSLQAAIDLVKEGVTLRELDEIATRVIREGGGEPSFLGYKSRASDESFPCTMCVSINDEVVHGLGNRDVKLKNGDLVGFDIGCWYDGLCTDMAVTVPVGGFDQLPKEQKQLLRTTRESMMAGVEAARVGGTVREISTAIQGNVKPHGFGIVRALVGHGVGHKVHEDPRVPNYVATDLADMELPDGICLAIEPMLTLGDWQVKTVDDGWTVVTLDGSLAAHFELTIAVTKDGVEILTPPPRVGF